ncbi:hypothetical protein F4808DRAFT_77915 [Astrocystis sublimbata]|nr:hypothetical protein F4808DRAFT_77915 [Astrocystis sublimbata]
MSLPLQRIVFVRLKHRMKAFLAKFHRPTRHRIPALTSHAHDVFARLPFELHVLVISYLEPRDLDAALDASKVIRLVWLSDEIWPALADYWFSGLAQQICLAVNDEPRRSEMFRRRLRRICKRTDAKFAAAMHYGFSLASDEFFQWNKNVPAIDGGVHSYESVEDLEVDDAQRFSRFMMYRNGRVAWWPEGYSMPYIAIVDDLHTRTRKAYQFPKRDQSVRGYKTAMGSKLFIMGHGTKLHVWHLELDRLDSFEVPENFKRCITEDERVLILSQNSDIYIWRFGGKLQRIDSEFFAAFIFPLSLAPLAKPIFQEGPTFSRITTVPIVLLTFPKVQKLSCYPREYIAAGGPPVWTPRIWLSFQRGFYLRNSQLLIDFILSPAVNDMFYVATLALDESGKLTVYECNESGIVGTYIMQDRIYSDPRTTERGLLKWEKVNSFGGYILVQVVQEPSSTGGLPEDACPCGQRSRQLASLCFNIYTKSFTTLRHHLGELSPWISHIWNNMLFIMDDRFQRQCTSNRRPVMTLAPCTAIDALRHRDTPIPMYTTIPDSAPLLYRRHQLPFDLKGVSDDLQVRGLNCTSFIDALQEFSPDPKWKRPFVPCPSEMNPGRLVGDDEFFIFVNSPSYTIFSFAEGFPINTSNVDESKPWWRKPRGKLT